MVSQRVGHYWATELNWTIFITEWLNWTELNYLYYLQHSLASDQTTGREHRPTHQQKIGLKLYWAWTRPSEQDPGSPQSVSPIRKLPQASYPSPSEDRQTENHNHRKLTNLITWATTCLTQWNYEPCCVGPPKMDGSWWEVLTKLESEVKVTQSCPTLCDPMDSTVHGILQARILEWVACPFSKGSSQTRDQTQISHIAGKFFPSWATREVQNWKGNGKPVHCSCLENTMNSIKRQNDELTRSVGAQYATGDQ